MYSRPKLLSQFDKSRRRKSRLAQPSLDKTNALPENFRRLLRKMPAQYRDQHLRNRILAGIEPGERVGLDRTNMIVLLWTFKCAAAWTQKDSSRELQWKAARHLGKNAAKRSDASNEAELKHITQTMTDTWIGTVEAYAALGFALAAGYNNHSLSLWRTFEKAFMSDVYEVFDKGKLEDARRFPRDRLVNDVFRQSEMVRLRLSYLRRENDEGKVSAEARRIFSILQDAPFTSSGIIRPTDRPRYWKRSDTILQA